MIVLEVSSRIQLLKQGKIFCFVVFIVEFNKIGGQQFQYNFESCWFQWYLGRRRNGYEGDIWNLVVVGVEVGRMYMF